MDNFEKLQNAIGFAAETGGYVVIEYGIMSGNENSVSLKMVGTPDCISQNTSEQGKNIFFMLFGTDNEIEFSSEGTVVYERNTEFEDCFDGMEKHFEVIVVNTPLVINVHCYNG